MQLEDYFDFQRRDDIRIKGTRIGIESVLYEYTHRGQTAEEIAVRFPTVTLEQVYATILFYLHNKESISSYLADWLEWGRVMREEQEGKPHSGIIHLRELREAIAAEAGEADVKVPAR